MLADVIGWVSPIYIPIKMLVSALTGVLGRRTNIFMSFWLCLASMHTALLTATLLLLFWTM